MHLVGEGRYGRKQDGVIPADNVAEHEIAEGHHCQTAKTHGQVDRKEASCPGEHESRQEGRIPRWDECVRSPRQRVALPAGEVAPQV